jgi:hypothetical protein
MQKITNSDDGGDGEGGGQHHIDEADHGQ